MMQSKTRVHDKHREASSLFGTRAREFGDRLGALGDGVLGEFTGEDEADGGLDLARRDGRLLGVCGEF
jgi:hypothetical protein